MKMLCCGHLKKPSFSHNMIRRCTVAGRTKLDTAFFRTEQVKTLNPLIGRCKLSSCIPGIDSPHWFYQHDVAFFSGDRLVLYVSWHYEHLSLFQGHNATSHFDIKGTLKDDERLISIFMAVPDKFSLYLHQFEVVIVHLGDDLWRPVLVELGQFLVKIDYCVFHPRSSLTILDWKLFTFFVKSKNIKIIGI